MWYLEPKWLRYPLRGPIRGFAGLPFARVRGSRRVQGLPQAPIRSRREARGRTQRVRHRRRASHSPGFAVPGGCKGCHRPRSEAGERREAALKGFDTGAGPPIRQGSRFPEGARVATGPDPKPARNERPHSKGSTPVSGLPFARVRGSRRAQGLPQAGKRR